MGRRLPEETLEVEPKEAAGVLQLWFEAALAICLLSWEPRAPFTKGVFYSVGLKGNPKFHSMSCFYVEWVRHGKPFCLFFL